MLKPLHPSKAESLLLLVIRLALGGMFLFSAWMKLSPANVLDLGPLPGPHFFAQAVRSFDLVPDAWVPLVTYAVPWTEVVVGVCLILGIASRAAGVLGFVLLAVFTAGVISVLVRGMNVHCGCFGRFKLICEGAISLCKVGENIVLMSLFWIIACRTGGRFGFDKGWLD